MKIATFNANSIRARVDIVVEWLIEHQPDVLAIQEIKCQDSDFPFDPFLEIGYQAAVYGQKTYNGVATLAKHPQVVVQQDFGDPSFPEDRRLLWTEIQGWHVINTYVPNGTKVGSEKFDYKLRWLERFRAFCDKKLDGSKKIVWLGDINVAPTSDDVFEPQKHLGSVGFHPEEIARIEQILDWGWIDLFRKFQQGPGHYTFWEFVIPNSVKRNLGWRIDHIYVPKPLAAKCTSCIIDLAPRLLERPSDHTFVVAEFTD